MPYGCKLGPAAEGDPPRGTYSVSHFLGGMLLTTLAGLPTARELDGISLDDDAAAADDDVAADGDARHHLDAAADPHVVAHRDGNARFDAAVAKIGVERMIDGIKPH